MLSEAIDRICARTRGLITWKETEKPNAGGGPIIRPRPLRMVEHHTLDIGQLGMLNRERLIGLIVRNALLTTGLPISPIGNGDWPMHGRGVPRTLNEVRRYGQRQGPNAGLGSLESLLRKLTRASSSFGTAAFAVSAKVE